MKVISASSCLYFQRTSEGCPCSPNGYQSRKNVFHKVTDKSRYLVARWCSNPAYVNKKNRQGNTPLFMAIKYRKPGVVRSFLKKGASLTVCDGNGDTPLHYAVKKGNREVVRVLLEHGADPDIRNLRNQPTPLELAVHSGDCEMLSLMIHNRDVGRKSNLLNAAIKTRNFEMARTLLRAGVHPNSGDRSPLLQVSKLSSEETILEDYDLIALLVNHGADLSRRDYLGLTVLHVVALKNQDRSHYDVMRYLLHKGADPNARDLIGTTPFHLVLANCDVDVVNLFLQHGARPSVSNKFGRSAMHYACNQKHQEVLHLLLDNGNSVHSTCDFYGMSVLFMAAADENLDNIRFLLKYGADSDLNVADINGFTPLLEVLVNHKHVAPVDAWKINDIVRLLLVCGTDINSLLKNYENSLLQHVTSFENDIWKTLIQHVAVLQESGKTVKPEILSEVSECEKYREYYDECLMELKEAKDTWIENINVFDLLASSRKKVSQCCMNKELTRKIDSDWFYVRFPIYKWYVEDKYLMGRSLKKLRNDAKLAVVACMENPLPDLVMEKVIDFMSLCDLRKICRNFFPN